jgi:hypothetical protein
LVRLGHWRTVVRRARHLVSAQRLRSAKGRDQPSATTFGGAVTYVGRARLPVRRRSEASQLLNWAIYPRLRCSVNARIGPFVLFFTKSGRRSKSCGIPDLRPNTDESLCTSVLFGLQHRASSLMYFEGD